MSNDRKADFIAGPGYARAARMKREAAEGARHFEVEMLAFGGGAIRPVTVPAERAECCRTDDDWLEAIFEYGQNDFQPVIGRPSVSVGDVIRYGEGRFKVVALGFERVS